MQLPTTDDTLILANATIIDGSGAAPFAGDITVVDGRIAAITPADAPLSYLHEMSLEARSGEDIDFTDQLQTRLESMFMAVWTGLAEDDGYNRLVLTAELAWRDVAVIRALSRYLRQAGIRFSEDYMWSTLNNYPRSRPNWWNCSTCASTRMSPKRTGTSARNGWKAN